jgi:3-deoxy-manno-octulosonate cytidylyltransferase (CMP-KDO synthetase)
LKIVGVIPARFASSRFPGKPLIDIGGKTMIRRVYEQSCKANGLIDVIVATDDQRIYDNVMQWGGKVMMTSTHHQNGTERCAEVLSNLAVSVDAVINIQGDEPFIDPAQIELLSALLQNPKCQIGTLVKRTDDLNLLTKSNIIKVAVSLTGQALYFSRSVIPYQRSSEQSIQYYKHIGIYGYRSDVLREICGLSPTPLEMTESLEQLRWLENGYTVHTAVTDLESISVDVPDDLDRIRKLYKSAL